MTTVKVKFRPSTIVDKEGCLYIQIIHQRVVKIINTEYRLFQEEWDADTASVIMAEADPERNAYLASITEQLSWDLLRMKRIIRTLEHERPQYHADDVATEFCRHTDDCSLSRFMQQVIMHLRQLGHHRTSETYTAALRSFMTFRDGVDIPLDAISSKTMCMYEAYLRQKDVCKNTISFYMRILRAVYNRAVDKGLTEQQMPFRHVYTGTEKTVKRAIDIKTIKQLRDLDLSGKPSMIFARDMFLFSFYTRGMSFIDIAYLKKTDLHDGMLVYRRRKTGQRLTIRWEKCMAEILMRHPAPNSDYLLPIIKNAENARHQYTNAMQNVNYNLKMISKRLGLSRPLTMYVARHSWASAAKSSRVPITVISEAMGHESEKTTQIYLASLENTVVDNANKLILKLLK